MPQLRLKTCKYLYFAAIRTNGSCQAMATAFRGSGPSAPACRSERFSESRRRSVIEARIDRGECLVAESQALHHSRTIIMNQHIGLGYELHENFAHALVLCINANPSRSDR
jgi:hypothetical protein